MDLATKLLVFFLALGGMIFLHELGHYLASRWAKIDVEEFGFGLPPRALALWRAKGYLLFNRQRVEIPKNFERNFDWFGVERRPAVATVDQDGDKYILRTMNITFEEKVVPPQPKAKQTELTVGANGQVVSESAPEPAVKTQTVSLGKERGPIEWTGQIDEVHPGTLLSLNWLPLGGFVRPKGETDPSVPGGLGAASPWKRIMVYVAGPVMNLVTAIVVYSLITGLQGVAVKGPVRLEEISPASPALEAGLQPNDVILSINGQTVSQNSDVSTIIYNNLDKPLTLVVDRGGQQVTLTATPLSSRVEGGQGPLGILMAAPATRPATLGEIVSNGVVITGIQAASIIYLPIALIQGAIKPEQAQIVGPVGIFGLISKAIDNDVASRQEVAQTSATSSPSPRPTYDTLLLIASLSVSLGIINLFPIPALDGGRILFTLPELLIRRSLLSTEKENIVNGVSMLLLITLMLFIIGKELLANVIK